MAFLAIPSVDDKGAGQQHCSVTQILCYLSVASNLATIITGLSLGSHHNTLKHVNVSVATAYFARHWQDDTGFERLSIVYSAPYAFRSQLGIFSGIILLDVLGICRPRFAEIFRDISISSRKSTCLSVQRLNREENAR
ncbi:hypothetical protein F5146DRAFT_1129449 [Armillaria mellea]|nr:hypothetical protein F5146DRAFT_1129449 [Armillaria mellea]